jgi:hypothetical protein
MGMMMRGIVYKYEDNVIEVVKELQNCGYEIEIKPSKNILDKYYVFGKKQNTSFKYNGNIIKVFNILISKLREEIDFNV